MKFELWLEEGSQLFCRADSLGDSARAMLDADAWLEWEVEASSYLDAMTKYYEHMDWGEYRSENLELELQLY